MKTRHDGRQRTEGGYLGPEERMVVAALALFVIIMAESGSGDTQQEQPAQGQ